MIENSSNIGINSHDNKRLIQKNLQRWSRTITEIVGLEEIVEYILPGSNEYRNFGICLIDLFG